RGRGESPGRPTVRQRLPPPAPTRSARRGAAAPRADRQRKAAGLAACVDGYPRRLLRIICRFAPAGSGRRSTMDLTSLREAAIEGTARELQQRLGIVPDEDSDEWEAEYRRQFALLKQRYGNEITVAPPRPAAPAGAERQWPALTGTPEEVRWGASIRDERL